jgi:hypothetical protein
MSKKNTSVIDWLLEESQPSIRYLALKELLRKPEKDPEVKAAKSGITKIGWAKEILEKQTPEGYWVRERSLFQPKYIATFWMLLVLSDLGLTKDNSGVARAANMWLERCRTKDGWLWNDGKCEGRTSLHHWQHGQGYGKVRIF